MTYKTGTCIFLPGKIYQIHLTGNCSILTSFKNLSLDLLVVNFVQSWQLHVLQSVLPGLEDSLESLSVSSHCKWLSCTMLWPVLRMEQSFQISFFQATSLDVCRQICFFLKHFITIYQFSHEVKGRWSVDHQKESSLHALSLLHNITFHPFYYFFLI